MNPLFSTIQFDKIALINKELDKSIKHLKYCNTIESDFIRAIDYIIESVDESVDYSVAKKLFTEEELPDKEVVRRVSRLWN